MIQDYKYASHMMRRDVCGKQQQLATHISRSKAEQIPQDGDYEIEAGLSAFFSRLIPKM